MASSRTGLASHLQWRKRVLARDQSAGITNCPFCQCELDYKNTRQPNSAEPDHILPVARGGDNTLDNGRVLCRRCNQSRGKGTTPHRNAAKVEASPIW